LFEKAFLLNVIYPIGTNVKKEPKIILTPPIRLLYRDYEDCIGGLREDFAVQMLKEKGFNLYYLKVPKGERVTINDLMSTIKMDPVENKNLANALYQLALAETIDVNQAGKQRYAERRGSYQPVYRPEGASDSVNLELQRRGTPAVDLPRQNIIFDSPAGFFYDTVNPTFIRNQQKGPLGPEGKSVTIQPRLRELSDPDAAAPFIGMVAGEEPVGIAGDPNTLALSFESKSILWTVLMSKLQVSAATFM
jgi:hypothetical protein